MSVPEEDSSQRGPQGFQDQFCDIARLTRELVMLRERLQHLFHKRFPRLCVHPVHTSRRGNKPSLNEIEVDDRGRHSTAVGVAMQPKQMSLTKTICNDPQGAKMHAGLFRISWRRRHPETQVD
jgi:hypothetical protein